MAAVYWLDVFTTETWLEFRQHGAAISGFPEGRQATVQRMRPGDLLLCYLTRYSRWVGLLKVNGQPYWDESPIWSKATYPSRVPVHPVVLLEPEQGIPVLTMRNELSVFQGLKNPNKWSGPFRHSPSQWTQKDGVVVAQAIQDAADGKVVRPLPPTAKPDAHVATVKDTDYGSSALTTVDGQAAEDEDAKAPSRHTEMQFLLMRLGAAMGYDVFVARGDPNREWRGRKLGDMPRRRASLPHQFDDVTNKTIEWIDVLWLDGEAIVAAFEIESTTQIYTGLLRMSDLIAMQPNLAIPLFLVAPEERRGKVLAEVNRPTFKRRKTPLAEVCRYISFERLMSALDDIGDNVAFLRPEWLQTVSESCESDI